MQWLLGVPADARSFDCPADGQVLRAQLLNPSEAAASVRLIGPTDEFEWTIEVGSARFVEVELSRGRFSFEAPAGIVLGSPRLGRPIAEPRLLVVMLVDTLRADHVTPDLMPGVIEAFAGGRAWRDATANASWTIPSVASMFTARPVLELTSPEGELIGLPEGMPTWAGSLYRAGFEGGAIVANYTVHALNGFASGFSSYLVPDDHDPNQAPDASWVVEESRRWLAAHRGENAFLYLHLMDPHEPYRRHDGVGDPPPPLKPLATRQRQPTAAEARLLSELYAGEVRHVDKVVTPFLAELPDRAVVVLVADHGESLGEHEAWGHGLNLYQEAVAVPLMVRGPGVVPGEVDEAVQLLDLGPTLVELCGLPPDPKLAGRSLLDGGSAVPMVSATFGAGPLRWAWRKGDHKIVVRMAAQPGLGAASRTQLSEALPLPAGAFHLDLAADPAENRPGPIPEALGPEVGSVLAGSAGRLVPGLQLFVWDGDGATAQELAIDGELDVVQAWSTGAMEVDATQGRLRVRCLSPSPVCAVSLASRSVPGSVTPLAGGRPWSNVPTGRSVDPRALAPPPVLDSGAYLWWNPDRTLVVEGHDETIERLRALGYID